LRFHSLRFLLDRVAVVTWIAQVWRNGKHNLAQIVPMRRKSVRARGNWRERSLFYGHDKISVLESRMRSHWPIRDAGPSRN
jgi:hypothetical protein